MSQEKADRYLEKIDERIDRGEFDEKLNIPFASKKLLKSLIKSKMDKKVETGGTPIISENNIIECIQEVRETAAEVAALFGQVGILQKNDRKIVDHPIYEVTEKWREILHPTK